MYTEITTVEEAFKRQKDQIDLSRLDLSSLPEKFSSGMLNLLMLQVIVDAVNNDDTAVPDWIPDYNNEDQKKWFPWYYGGDETGAGFSFDVAHYDWSNTDTYGGARLALKDKARAIHMNKYFQPLYKALWLVLKA